ncbi:MAG: SPOR domain-containing protein [Bacteroidaceae bacterium]|nr:SPOR domain-containing protein [Bacteroidaceae bacterium]
MKKIIVFGLAIVALTITSCKSSKESAYKAAYDQAKQQELVQGQSQTTDLIEIAPVASSSTMSSQAVDTSYREEKVVLASGAEGSLKAFSVVCGSFASKTNAEALQGNLVSEGYSAIVVQNPTTGMYRVVCASYDDKQQAAEARAKFKAEHPGNADFQKAWLLYNK